MLTVVTKLFSRRPKESHRERALSNQVDHLEYKLAKARHERDVARLRLADERAAFDQHRLRHNQVPLRPTLHAIDHRTGQIRKNSAATH